MFSSSWPLVVHAITGLKFETVGEGKPHSVSYDNLFDVFVESLLSETIKSWEFYFLRLLKQNIKKKRPQILSEMNENCIC